MTEDKFENLLVNLCFLDWSKLPDALKRIGLRTSFVEDYSTIVIHGAMTCGFSEGVDAQGRAIQLCFAVAGARGFSAFPNLLEKVDQRRGIELRERLRKHQIHSKQTGISSREKILNFLSQNPNVRFSVIEIADAVDLSLKSVRSHVHYLLRDNSNGLVLEAEGKHKHCFYFDGGGRAPFRAESLVAHGRD